MIKRNYKEMKSNELKLEDAKGVYIKWMISKDDGAPNFAMRFFEIEPKGHTPYHKHEWEHEVFIKEGEGVYVSEGKEIAFKSGDAIFVPPLEPHQFKNTKDKKLEFLCIIPNKGK